MIRGEEENAFERVCLGGRGGRWERRMGHSGPRWVEAKGRAVGSAADRMIDFGTVDEVMGQDCCNGTSGEENAKRRSWVSENTEVT